MLHENIKVIVNATLMVSIIRLLQYFFNDTFYFQILGIIRLSVSQFQISQQSQQPSSASSYLALSSSLWNFSATEFIFAFFVWNQLNIVQRLLEMFDQNLGVLRDYYYYYIEIMIHVVARQSCCCNMIEAVLLELQHSNHILCLFFLLK